jgi:hypothetical protein
MADIVKHAVCLLLFVQTGAKSRSEIGVGSDRIGSAKIDSMEETDGAQVFFRRGRGRVRRIGD